MAISASQIDDTAIAAGTFAGIDAASVVGEIVTPDAAG